MVGLQIRGLSHKIVVAVSRAELPLRIQVEIGSSSPALIGAAGRCVAAFGRFTRSEIERKFQALRWYRAPSLKQWRAQVESARKSGYAVDEGNYFQGLTTVAVPILDENGVITHAVDAVGVSEQIAKIGIVRLATQMRARLASLSELQDRGGLLRL